MDTHKLRGGVYFVDSMPKGVTGKNLRREAKEIAIKLYEMKKQNGQNNNESINNNMKDCLK